jgi:RND family efflux transporter MFP subunit
VRLAEDDHLRLVIPVPESAVPHIHEGGSVDVRVPSLNRTFSGRIARFSDQVDAATRTMHVELNVENPTRELVPGMYAEASVVLEQVPNALIVPAQAMDHSDEGVTVLRVNPSGTLERRPITITLETADGAQVVSGLAEGDLVVVGPRSQLHTGQTVQPQLAAPGAAGGR